MKRQFQYVEAHRGIERAITSFRKMAHWYAKAMSVRASLRNSLQTAKTKAEFEAVLDDIAATGPSRTSKTGELPELHIPVPSGPNERW